MMHGQEFVDWYHRKFVNSYPKSVWPTVYNDHRALVHVIEKFDVKTILEIGTWQGWTALMMWLHPNVEALTTVDIHKDMNIPYDHAIHHLQDKSFYGEYCKFTPVKQVFQDSMTLTEDIGHFDMVFVEGNHDYEHCKHDTELALRIADKVVAWHDVWNIDTVAQVVGYVPDCYLVAGTLVAYKPMKDKPRQEIMFGDEKIYVGIDNQIPIVDKT